MKYHDIFEARYHVHPIVNALRKRLEHKRYVESTEFSSVHLESALQALRDELGPETDHIDDDLYGIQVIEWSWETNNFDIMLKVIPPTVKEIDDKTEKVILRVRRKD